MLLMGCVYVRCAAAPHAAPRSQTGLACTCSPTSRPPTSHTTCARCGTSTCTCTCTCSMHMHMRMRLAGVGRALRICAEEHRPADRHRRDGRRLHEQGQGALPAVPRPWMPTAVHGCPQMSTDAHGCRPDVDALIHSAQPHVHTARAHRCGWTGRLPSWLSEALAYSTFASTRTRRMCAAWRLARSPARRPPPCSAFGNFPPPDGRASPTCVAPSALRRPLGLALRRPLGLASPR